MNYKKPLILGVCVALLAMLPMASASSLSLSWSSWHNYWNGYQWVTPGYGYYPYYPTYYRYTSPSYFYPTVQQHTTNIINVQQPQPHQESTVIIYSSPTQGSQGSQVSAQARCGDGWCSAGETKENCPGDCSPAPYCGDGACGNGETVSSCPHDCKQVSNSYCGDGTCSKGETKQNCPDDCGAAPYCGDQKCSGAETKQSCPEDCGLAPYCGDNKCDLAESKYNCPQDCGLPSYCGDNACDRTETKYSCPRDCGYPECSSPKGSEGDKTCDDGEILTCEKGLWQFEKSVQCCDDSDCSDGYECEHNSCHRETERINICGDGLCTDGETPRNCPIDCGSVAPACGTCPVTRYCGDGTCNNGETYQSCPQDCRQVRTSYCGDGVCDLSKESQQNCPQDCGYALRHSIVVTASDECSEIEQGNSSKFKVIMANTGDAIEELSLSASGPAAAWASYPKSVVLVPNSSRVVDVTISVPEGTQPGLYNMNLKAQNSKVTGTALLRVDVRLPLEEIVITNQTTTAGNRQEAPTGGLLVGNVRIPDWALVVIVALGIACIVLIILIRRTSDVTVGTRLTAISQKVKEPVLTTDGGFRRLYFKE